VSHGCLTQTSTSTAADRNYLTTITIVFLLYYAVSLVEVHHGTHTNAQGVWYWIFLQHYPLTVFPLQHLALSPDLKFDLRKLSRWYSPEFAEQIGFMTYEHQSNLPTVECKIGTTVHFVRWSTVIVRKSKSEDDKVAVYYEDVLWNHGHISRCSLSLGVIQVISSGKLKNVCASNCKHMVDLNSDVYRLCSSLHGLDILWNTFWLPAWSRYTLGSRWSEDCFYYCW